MNETEDLVDLRKNLEYYRQKSDYCGEKLNQKLELTDLREILQTILTESIKLNHNMSLNELKNILSTVERYKEKLKIHNRKVAELSDKYSMLSNDYSQLRTYLTSERGSIEFCQEEIPEKFNKKVNMDSNYKIYAENAEEKEKRLYRYKNIRIKKLPIIELNDTQIIQPES